MKLLKLSIKVFLFIFFFLTFYLFNNSNKIYAGCKLVCTSACTQNWPFSPPDQCTDDAYKGCEGYDSWGTWNGCCRYKNDGCTWTATFAGNGGTCTPTSSGAKAEGSAISAPSCSRAGYNLNGFIIDVSANCTGFNSTTGACDSIQGDFTATAQWVTANNKPSAPTALQTNSATNPVGVVTLNPTFSALFQDPDSGQTGNWYQIEVNSNSSFTGTVLWNSGKTAMTATAINARSPQITYAGTALSLNGTTYYWRIRFWDNLNLEGTVSSYATFTMGCTTCSLSCPVGTSSTVNSDLYDALSCTNSCSQVTNLNCYCNICSPTSCLGPTYSTINSGFGSTVFSCRNGSSSTPNQTTQCNITSRTCYCQSKCTTFPSCPVGTSEFGSFGTYASYYCTNPCGVDNSKTCRCDTMCIPSSCPAGTSESGTHGTYNTYSCTNACGTANSRTCKCDSSCSPTACPVGTSETASAAISPLYPVGLTDPYNTYNCANSCSENISRSCFCQSCTTAPLCGPVYSASDLTFGKVPDTLTPSCRNGLSTTPNQSTLCNLTYRDCYCQAFKSCPAPLTNTGSASLILEGFRENTNICGVSPIETEDDCYEVFSSQPTENLLVDSSLAIANDYGFSSDTRTGDYEGPGNPDTTVRKQGRLNDPLSPIKLVAKYSDTNGASDIEGLFVWFRDESKYTGLPETPVLQSDSETPKTGATDSWGFMLRREGVNWVPYVPSYGSSNYWTKLPITPTVYPFSFFIYGPAGDEMIEVTILERPSEVGNEVTMKYSLKFSDDNGDLFDNVNKVSAVTYKVWLMGLDKFSFTPYDNYVINYGTYWTSEYTRNPDTTLDFYWKPEQLRFKTGQEYARAWTDTTQSWVIDFSDPVVTFSKTIDIDTINISWTASDDKNLYAVVGNIYSNAGADARPIDLNINGTPSAPISLNSSTGIITPGSVGANIVGNLDNGWVFKVSNLNTKSNSGSIDIKVQDNTTGTLTMYLHVFDDAGNVTEMTLVENLADRILTAGGLSYSEDGTTFAQLTPTDDASWTNPMTSSPSQGLLRINAGLTSEMLARYDSSFLPQLSNSDIGSYSINNYRNNPITTTVSFYDSFLEAFEIHKKYFKTNTLNEVPPFPDDSTMSSTQLATICGGNEYCKLVFEANLLINSGAVCNKKALIFVQGNLTIVPPLYNSSPDSLSHSRGCIFVVKGDVLIGANPVPSATFGYDKINAFIVSDGVITISQDTTVPPSAVDGVYINGGLISRGGVESIDVKRYLRLQERLLYPVLAIDLHPKYGILAEDFFGNNYILQKAEIGLKPY